MDTNSKIPSVLIVCTATGFGGAETHALKLHQSIFKKGQKSTILVTKNSPLEQKIKELKLPYYACKIFKKKIFLGISTKPGKRHISKIVEKEKVNIVHCNEGREVLIAKKLAKKQNFSLVFTRHVASHLRKKTLNDLDAVIGVSKHVTEYLRNQIEENKYNTKRLVHIPPLYFEEKFIAIPTMQTTQKNNKNTILCNIANLYKTKNHELLLHAIQKLVYEKKRSVHLTIAGEGPLEKILNELVIKLKIENFVNFVGFSNNVAEIFYHSDINIISSKQEGLSIALLEASLMKKPSIAPDKTGTCDIIKNNKTGLLFKNDNVNDLVSKIEMLIENKDFSKKLGQNAHDFVRKNFCVKTNTERHIDLYNDLINDRTSSSTI
jgi:glycosyltransferase involved in cell wall biosynthesis